MKRRPLIIAIAALLAAGGLWIARSNRDSDQTAVRNSADTATKTASDNPDPGQMVNPTNTGHTLTPPDPARKFREFTPEQRVEFARKGHGPGG